MKQVGEREKEQIEVIDRKSEEVIFESWQDFTFQGHTDYTNDYFGSILAYNPRRTSESYFSHHSPMTPAEAFRKSNPVPKDLKTLQELWDWHKPLIEAENKHEEKEEKK